jgi:hypothetical protein
VLQGLWLRLEDAEVFFYATSRIHPDRRFQIEQRRRVHVLNSTLTYETLTYSLIIDGVYSSDDGTYSCQADNKIIKLYLVSIVGKTRVRVLTRHSSRVTRRSLLVEERPYFITNEYQTLFRTKIGRNVSITCEAQGKPSPSIIWRKKNDGRPRVDSLVNARARCLSRRR